MTERIKFKSGTVVCTIGASEVATRPDMLRMLERHLRGDWGDVPAEDAKAIEDALTWGDRILSSYKTESGERLWLLTEASREQTTILTPGEY